MPRKETMGLTAWADRLSNIDLPVMAGVLKNLNQLTAKGETSADELAAEIMKDAALTAKVLKVSNSVLFHPGSEDKFTSINRAIVQVGFPGIRAICISVMMIDSMLGSSPREELLKCMARGFHSAVQARNLLPKESDDAQEDAFIAALLMHIGDMAFWSMGGKQAETYAELIERGVMDIDEASRRVIGTNLRSISLALAKRWGLGTTLTSSLASPRSKNPKVRAVVLADLISKTAEKGWDSPEFGDVLAKVSKFTGRSILDVRDSVIASAEEAADVAKTYGAQDISHLIPSAANEDEQTKVRSVMKGDPQFQLDVLRELSDMANQHTDVNTIFQTVIEGLHRGVGLERVSILLLNREGDELVSKYALGEGTENWGNVFSFEARREDDNIFAYSLKQREFVHVKGKKDPEFNALLPLECLRLVKGEFLISPIHTGVRDIGVFYADKGCSDSKIPMVQYDSFKYFAREANASLAKLAQTNRSNNERQNTRNTSSQSRGRA